MERLVMSTCSILMALPLSAKCRKLLLRPPMKLFCAKLLCNLINIMSKAFCLSILPATSRGIKQPQLIKWFSTSAQSLLPPIFLPGLPKWEFSKQLLFKSIPNSTPSPSKHSLLLAIPILMRKSAFHGPFMGFSLLLLANFIHEQVHEAIVGAPFRPTCYVTETGHIQTFDERFYKYQMDNSYHVVASDCTAKFSTAVLAKHVPT